MHYTLFLLFDEYNYKYENTFHPVRGIHSFFNKLFSYLHKVKSKNK